MSDRKVDDYNITGPTILHQASLLVCLNDGLRLTPDESLYERGCCGGTRERSSSTIEIPDIDINAKFKIESKYIIVHPTKDRIGNDSFLYKIEVVPEFREKVDGISLLMQYHPTERNIEPKEIEKSLAKSYVKKKGKIFLSSHLARWQLLGVIKDMRKHGLEVSESSRMVSEVGLKNGVYNVMLYDTMVCRRGILRRNAFKNLLEEKIKNCDHDDELRKAVDLLVTFFPATGVQVDYTAGFRISRDAVPDNATDWIKRDGDWPLMKLKEEVLDQGAVLVPKTFKASDENERSIGWRINFDLNMILNDPDYSPNIDTRRILIILKDLKNLKMRNGVVKSYTLKVCLVWAMYEHQQERGFLSNKDLLIATLEYLQEALCKMKLPDFFNEKFNHFHRIKDRRYEAKEVSDRIKYCVQHFDKTLDDLTEEQTLFMRKVRRDIFSGRPNISAVDCDKVGQQLSRLNTSDVKNVCRWMLEFTESLSSEDFELQGKSRDKKKVSRISVPANRWQRKLKKSYDDLFGNQCSSNYDSNFIYPLPSPDDLLSVSILENFYKNKEPPETIMKKLNIWAELDRILKTEFTDCEVAGFGSSFTGFGLRGSDLDLVVFVEKLETAPRDFLFKLRQILISSNFAEEKGARVVKAKIPVLKGKHRKTSISFDLSVKGNPSWIPTSVRAAHLFYHCGQSEPRVRPLVLAVKRWAQSHDINNPHKKSLSSHALALMVVHYLQVNIRYISGII